MLDEVAGRRRGSAGSWLSTASPFLPGQTGDVTFWFRAVAVPGPEVLSGAPPSLPEVVLYACTVFTKCTVLMMDVYTGSGNLLHRESKSKNNCWPRIW